MLHRPSPGTCAPGPLVPDARRLPAPALDTRVSAGGAATSKLAGPGGVKPLFVRRLTLVLSVWIAVAGCGPGSESGPSLTPQERALVDAYVRISVLEAWRADEPDSVGPALDRLAASYDSTAVRAALAGLDADPERWETVFDTIAKRLHELEKEPSPRVALRHLDGALNHAGPAKNPEPPRTP